jgi:hypothetical protein
MQLSRAARVPAAWSKDAVDLADLGLTGCAPTREELTAWLRGPYIERLLVGREEHWEFVSCACGAPLRCGLRKRVQEKMAECLGK